MITSTLCTDRFGQPDVNFERNYMTLYVPSLELREAIPCLPKRIYCHKLLVEPLKKALTNLVSNGVATELGTWDGCFNVRKMRGGTSMSIHSWGLAIDVNAKTNTLGAKPTLSSLFVKSFKDAGFDWGGDWQRKDGMHFQLACI